jgi:hypothetical protein
MSAGWNWPMPKAAVMTTDEMIAMRPPHTASFDLLRSCDGGAKRKVGSGDLSREGGSDV